MTRRRLPDDRSPDQPRVAVLERCGQYPIPSDFERPIGGVRGGPQGSLPCRDSGFRAVFLPVRYCIREWLLFPARSSARDVHPSYQSRAHARKPSAYTPSRSWLPTSPDSCRGHTVRSDAPLPAPGARGWSPYRDVGDHRGHQRQRQWICRPALQPERGLHPARHLRRRRTVQLRRDRQPDRRPLQLKTTGASAVTDALEHTSCSPRAASPAPTAARGLSDPIVAYDEQIGRFIVGDQDVELQHARQRLRHRRLQVEQPDHADPADWNFYQINTTEAGFDADYPGNFGYNHDAFVFTLNMFGVSGPDGPRPGRLRQHSRPGHGVPQPAPRLPERRLADFSLRPTTMHDSVAGDPMWLVTEHGDNTIDRRLQDDQRPVRRPPPSPYTHLAVNAYSDMSRRAQATRTAPTITTNIDSRIHEGGGGEQHLVATHAVSAQLDRGRRPVVRHRRQQRHARRFSRPGRRQRRQQHLRHLSRHRHQCRRARSA